MFQHSQKWSKPVQMAWRRPLHKAIVSRSSSNSNWNNSRRYISWRFTNHEPCAICLKNMNAKSFIAYKINIIACTRALQLPFIPTSESGEINSQHVHEFFSFKFIHLIENCIPFIHLFRLKNYNWKVYLNGACMKRYSIWLLTGYLFCCLAWFPSRHFFLCFIAWRLRHKA